MTEHEDTYSRNAQAWHYTNAQINELIQEAEQALEFRDRQSVRWSPRQMPRGFFNTSRPVRKDCVV